VAWCLPRPARAPGPAPEARNVATGRLETIDSLTLWRLRAERPEWREPAMLRWSEQRARAGDSSGADSVLAGAAFARSIWGWDALLARTKLALARGDTLAADTLLRAAASADWTLAEQAAWHAESARLAAARGDTARALSVARSAMRRFPSLPGASASLRLVDSIAAARGESLAVADARAAASVEEMRGSFAAAARRLELLIPRLAVGERGDPALMRAQFLRRARRFDAARAAIATALAAADSADRPQVLLERARILRDAGRADSALAAFERVARIGPPRVREAARWERARELHDAGRWAEAAAGYEAVFAEGTRRADARFLAGLMAYAAGRPDTALRRWAGDTLESSTFWRGVELRRRRDPLGNSLLRELAARPGYTFYRAAARDTLGTRGMPDSVSVAPMVWNDFTTRLATLARSGLADDALRLASRRFAGDPRLGSSVDSLTPGEVLGAAHVAWVSGRPSHTVTHALLAQRMAVEVPLDQQWAVVPWAYPPAFDSLVIAAADSLGLEPALVWAVMRQESRFDPDARSVSNALGLMQLLLPAAQDAAGWAKEPRPTGEGRLLDPVTNLKWGARYLARLIQRFDGRIAVALSAYNAGPSTVPPFWRELVARGGEALFCEVASNSDAQDYARRILGYRQAYRELRPRVRP